MRDILFRGKRIDNGEWEYGYIVHTGDFPNGDCRDEHLLDFWVITNGYTQHEINPDTVGQFTSLFDKHIKKIFEGDIVKIESNEYGEREPSIFYVYWNEPEACFSTKIIQDGGYVSDLENAMIAGEIIGNICDNPELLEV